MSLLTSINVKSTNNSILQPPKLELLRLKLLRLGNLCDITFLLLLSILLLGIEHASAEEVDTPTDRQSLTDDAPHDSSSIGKSKEPRSEKEPMILVTGLPMTESLQSYSGSVSLIRGEELQETGTDFLQNQLIQLPNVNFSGGSSRPKFFQIRGIGDLEQYEGAPNSSVAVILDDVDVTGVGAALTLFDIDQLEVHRGPQATRFGSSAMAGAISLNSAEPSEALSGTTLFSAGNDQLVSIGSALGGTITPGLSARVSVFGHHQNGFRDNEFLNTDDTNERQEFTGRAKVRAQLSDDARITLQLLNVDLDNGYDAFSIFNGFETQSDRPGRDEESLRLVSLRGEFRLSDSLHLDVNSSYYQSKNEYSFDGDWGNNPFWAPFDPYDYFSDSQRNRDVTAQLIRLRGEEQREAGALRYVLGGYWQHLSERTTTSEFADNQEYDYLRSHYSSDIVAGFASVDLPLNQSLRLNIGLRGEERRSDFLDSRGADFSPDDLMWGGDVALRYTALDSFTPYVRFARGFRGGGFNSSPSLPRELLEYDPEALLSVEFGTRFQLFDDRWIGSLSTFFNYRDEQQLRLALQVDPNDPLSFAYVTENAAEGYGIGAELESALRITDSLSLQTQLALLDTRAEVDEGVLDSLDGRQQSHAPSWQYAVQVEKFLNDSLSVQTGISGRDAFYFDDSHDARSQPYHLVHASLFYFSDTWRLQFWGRNLTDERYAVRGFFFGNEPPDFPNKTYVQLGDPRSFGFTWTYFLN